MSKTLTEILPEKTDKKLSGYLLQVAGWGCVLIATVMFVILYLPDKSIGFEVSSSVRMLLYTIQGILAGSAVFIINIGKGMTAPSVKEVITKDPRPPIVYLRSFSVDRNDGVSSAVMFGVPGLSEEQYLTNVFSQIGPFISIGNPHEHTKTLGAARMYVVDDEWREKIDVMMGHASVVVLRAGCSEGFVWELKRAIEHVSPEKLIIFLPARHNSRDKELLSKFISLANESLPAKLPLDVGNASFIVFDSDWSPQVLSPHKETQGLKNEFIYAKMLSIKFPELKYETNKFSIKRVSKVLVPFIFIAILILIFL